MSVLTSLRPSKGDHLESVERPGSSNREEWLSSSICQLQFLFKYLILRVLK